MQNPNIKHNNRVLGLVAGDLNKNEIALIEFSEKNKTKKMERKHD